MADGASRLEAAAADRAALERIVDLYLAALIAGDPGLAPLADDAAFAENDQRLPIGSASWRTIERLGAYRHVFADPGRGDVGVIANVVESGLGAILVVRLKVAGGLIAEIEQFVSRDPDGFRRYEELGSPEPIWLEAIPRERRQSREALEAASWMYFQALERNDGAGIYPFTDDCQRLEHARKAIATDGDEDYGHAETSVSFTSMKAKQQYALGLMGYISRVRDRRVLVTDVERGAVLGSCVFDFDGDVERIDLTGGDVFRIPDYFRTPRSHQMSEAFKVLNGDIAYIEMTLIEVPYASRPAWTKVPSARIVFDPPRLHVPPAAATTSEDLAALVERVLEAMTHNCPCTLPLAADPLYTENGIPVVPGRGLWNSLGARRGEAVLLTDPERGEAGWIGGYEEHGLFAAIGLRLKVVDGRIAELEAVAARPEKHAPEGQLGEATHTMFTRPMAHDLPRSGLTGLAGAGRAGDRDEILGAVTDYYAGGGSVACYENGAEAAGDPALKVPIRRRTWLADPATGLALDLVLVDHPGQPAADVEAPFSAPATDLHLRLFRTGPEGMAEIHSIVRRLPYGAAGPWDEAPGS